MVEFPVGSRPSQFDLEATSDVLVRTCNLAIRDLEEFDHLDKRSWICLVAMYVHLLGMKAGKRDKGFLAIS